MNDIKPIKEDSNESLVDYSLRLKEALSTVDQSDIELLINEISKRLDGLSSIYLLGNGGSQANAHHIVGDYLKTFALSDYNIKINCLADNTSYLTAAANDIEYSEVYSILIGKLISPKDLIIYLSGSGNSINLVKCAQKASQINITQIAITAFNGGRLKDIVDIPIHIKVSDMEIAEDCQISIFHNIKQRLSKKFVKPSSENDLYKKYSKRVIEDLVI